MIAYRTNPFPSSDVRAAFWQRAWGGPLPANHDRVLSRSLAHACAYDGDRLVGFINLAWDGGLHAFILDTSVDPDYRRQGIATELVRLVAEIARNGGVHWLHVDFEPHLDAFYRACGFSPTSAGLMRLDG